MNRKPNFEIKFPYATVVFMIILSVVYVSQNHPHTGVQIGQYVLSALSSFTIGQFYSEITLLAVSGFIAEQFMPSSLVAAFLLIVGPMGDWLVEATHTYTLVLGLSSATVGLLGFGILAVFWSFIYYHENLGVRLVLSGFMVYALLNVFDAFWGVYAHESLYHHVIYHPHTAYLAHLFGITVGFGLWVFLHEVYGVE